MTLEELKNDPKSRRKGPVCDPCQEAVKPTVIGLLGPAVPEVSIATSGAANHIPMGHRSDHCWKADHDTNKCVYAWCDCPCHKGENDSYRLNRALSRQQALHTRSGGQRVLVDTEDGPPRWMTMLPDGDVIDFSEDPE
jgi:hypothetical protein